MPREKKYDIVSDLQNLSTQADVLIEEGIQGMSSYNSGLNAWFQAVKDTITQIKNCNSINQVVYAPHLNVFLGEEKKAKEISTSVSESQKEHVHDSIPSEKAINNKENSETLPEICIAACKEENCSDMNDKSSSTIVASTLNSNLNPVVQVQQIETPKINIADFCNNAGNSSSYKTPSVQKTPFLNRTFNKTIVISTPVNSHQNAKNVNDSDIKIKSQLSAAKSLNVSEDKTILFSETPVNRNINAVVNKSKMKTGSVAAENLMKSPGSGIITRSGSKRKSSELKNKSSKRHKMEASKQSSKTTKKVASLKHPVSDKKVTKTAVIVPSMQHKISVKSKEQQTLEEMKKKEEKAVENRKRVLAERQMKAEQNKKSREERITKLQEKRKQMEKEKEEKREAEAKAMQVKVVKENPVKQPVAKTRTQELVEQHAKASKSGVLTSSKQNENHGEPLTKTPANRKSSDYENYELTPLPNSSTYNFSDDEDDKPSGKPIPPWAQGLHLKSALLSQYYNPIDTDALFGSHIDPPNLTAIFGVKKKHYIKRTSSAVWNSPPRKY